MIAKKRLYYSLLIIGIIFWGISYVVIKETLKSVDVFVFTFYKFFIASLSLVFIFPQKIRAITKASFSHGLIIGLVLFIASITQYIGLEYTTATNAGFITGLFVILIPLFQWLFLKKKISFKIIVSVIIGFLGLYILTWKKGLSYSYGDILVLICAVGYAWHILTIGMFSKKSDPLVLTFFQLIVTALLSILFLIYKGISLGLHYSLNAWLGILFSALLPTAFMYTVQNYSQRYISEEKIALLFLLEPVFAFLASLIFLHEPFTIQVFFGGVLIMGGLIISELKINNKQQKIEEPLSKKEI